MHILGIANGTPGGNSEVLLKAALLAAKASSPSTTLSWFHAPSVRLPQDTVLKGSLDISEGVNEALRSDEKDTPSPQVDDISAVREAVLNSDAIIFSTPIYSHMPHGTLKALFDKFAGPFMDTAFATRVKESQKAGEKKFQGMPVDDRILKPRVVGFICTGGSDSPDQVSLALPGLHLLVYPFHAKVVDQVVLQGLAATGIAALADDKKPLQRAELLGRVSTLIKTKVGPNRRSLTVHPQNVASQLGKPYDEAQYLGEELRGACPYCHLTKIDMFQYGVNNSIACVCCGAQGKLVVQNDGLIVPEWEPDCHISSLTMKGKVYHLDYVMEVSGRQKSLVASEELKEEKRKWAAVDIPKVQMGSSSR